MEVTIRREDGAVVCRRCILADNPWTRFRGLMWRSELPPGEGLLLTTASIHTSFVRFPIDVVFLDEKLAVVDVRPNLKPWRIAISRRAHAVLELRAGATAALDLRPGERLALVHGGASVETPSGDDADDGARRLPAVAVMTDDSSFMGVAAFLLRRHGYHVETARDADELLAILSGTGAAVAVIDGSESLAAAARIARAIEVHDPTVGIVVVADGERAATAESPSAALRIVSKWSSFTHILDAVQAEGGTLVSHGLV